MEKDDFGGVLVNKLNSGWSPKIGHARRSYLPCPIKYKPRRGARIIAKRHEMFG
jgi:hypothetical protein